MAFLYFWQLFFIYVTEDFQTGTTFRYCIIVHASFFLCWDFAMLPAQLQSFSAIWTRLLVSDYRLEYGWLLLCGCQRAWSVPTAFYTKFFSWILYFILYQDIVTHLLSSAGSSKDQSGHYISGYLPSAASCLETGSLSGFGFILQMFCKKKKSSYESKCIQRRGKVTAHETCSMKYRTVEELSSYDADRKERKPRGK